MSATRFAVSVKANTATCVLGDEQRTGCPGWRPAQQGELQHTFLVCGEGETETVVQVGEFGSGWAIVSVR
jgi:hypothetical protein